MKNLLLHLRLNISIVLAPIFLWGFFIAGKNNTYNFWISFFIFHVFLYGGSNAYNSYYDKDEGPIGGLKNPPKITDSLLYFSLSIKILGLIIAYFININFFFIYLICMVLSIIYSYPKTRWKADPNLSLFTVGFGQGGLAFMAGYFSQITYISNFNLFISAMFVTIFMSSGIYPLTQIYQIEEDSKRGDITFAVKYGVKKSFLFSILCSILSFLAMFITLYLKSLFIDMFLICFFYSFFIFLILNWSKKFDEKLILANYEKIMKINYMNAIGFIAFILIKIFST
ncbi:MAG: UbiA family prenyltransferase [Candidatus Sericytochromatia bacterium]